MAPTILPCLVCALCLLASAIECFVVPQCRTSTRQYHDSALGGVALQQREYSLTNIRGCARITAAPYLTTLKAVEKDESTTSKSSLSSLGYTDEEIQLSQNRDLRQQKGEKLKVQVNLLPDIDSVTLTALGFALIAFNFFVLGNLEDGGIAGVVATIINTLSQ